LVLIFRHAVLIDLALQDTRLCDQAEDLPLQKSAVITVLEASAGQSLGGGIGFNKGASGTGWINTVPAKFSPFDIQASSAGRECIETSMLCGAGTNLPFRDRCEHSS
jgi:hypothetical protein